MADPMLSPSSDEFKEILEAFLVETTELVENLDRDFVILEKNPGDPQLLNKIFRNIHTIKGTSGFIGFDQLQALTHAMEGLLNKLRNGELRLTGPMTDALLHALDAVKILLDDIRGGRKEERAIEPLIRALERASDPDASTGEQPAAATPSVVGTPGASQEKKSSPSGGTIGVKETVRVDVERLDMMMNMIGELVLSRNGLQQMFSRVGEMIQDEMTLDHLQSSVNQLDLVTSNLQEIMSRLRMQPIDRVFSKYPRMIRDLAREAGREVDLEITGEETELDKSVIEQINDPLIHLIRNAIDHGIESPDDRVRAGKSPRGKISVGAAQEGNNIVIHIRDDGRGIDTDAVKTKAVRKGLIAEAEAEGMSSQDVYDLLFIPGFSTRDQVTNISGRGVGMDVVKMHVERLNGVVQIASELGRGTDIRLQIPLTLAIIHVLLVQIGADVFAVPLNAIGEIAGVQPSDIKRVGRQDVVVLRKEIIPLIRLESLFGFPAEESDERSYVLVTSIGKKHAGLVVRQIIGQEEIVIKGLGGYIQQESGCFAGASILGDGRVVLIVDIPSVLRICQTQSISGKGS